MCQGLNSHYFHIIGDGHQPNSRGLYTHYKDSLFKVGWPSPIQGVDRPDRTYMHHLSVNFSQKLFRWLRLRAPKSNPQPKKYSFPEENRSILKSSKRSKGEDPPSSSDLPKCSSFHKHNSWFIPNKLMKHHQLQKISGPNLPFLVLLPIILGPLTSPLT